MRKQQPSQVRMAQGSRVGPTEVKVWGFRVPLRAWDKEKDQGPT